jgi:hypothetical protein
MFGCCEGGGNVIYSKANLQVSQVASTDPFDRGLHGVKFEPDGSTVAGNGKVMVAVGPADPEKVHFPDKAGEQLEVGDHGILMPLDAVVRAIQHMPKDKRMSLQHVALTRVKDPARVGFTSVNAKGDPTTNASLPKTEKFPPWREAVQRIAGPSGGSSVQICVNRKDMIKLLKTLEAACPDKGDANPVFLEISENGVGMVARCMNHETRQHAVGVLTAYKTGDQWLQHDEWERGVFGTVVATRKKIARRLVSRRVRKV